MKENNQLFFSSASSFGMRTTNLFTARSTVDLPQVVLLKLSTGLPQKRTLRKSSSMVTRPLS